MKKKTAFTHILVQMPFFSFLYLSYLEDNMV